MRFVFGKGLMTLLQFRGRETELSFCNVPECAKASIDSQEWRDLLAAAVREFDRKHIVDIADCRKSGSMEPVELKCPVCGIVVVSGVHEWKSGYFPKFDDGGRLTALEMGTNTVKCKFECICGCRTECEASR